MAVCCGLMMATWVGVIHLLPPLPRLVYGDPQAATLHTWRADCDSVFSLCEHSQVLLEGLNLHPVAQPSPDGAYIAVYMGDGWVMYPSACLLEKQPCEPTPLDADANDTRLAWGPDGTTVAYMVSDSPVTMRIRGRGCWDGGSEDDCWAMPVDLAVQGAMRQPAWSGDGSRFAFIGLQPNGLFVLDAACLDSPGGCIDQRQPLTVNLLVVYWPSLSRDGSKILFFEQAIDSGGQVYVADVETASVRQLTHEPDGAMVPAWSFDERYVAYTAFGGADGGDVGIHVLDVTRGLSMRAIWQDGRDLDYPAWNP